MKNHSMLFWSFLVCLSVFIGCGNDNLASLRYDDISTGDWLEAKVRKKGNGHVLTIQMFDLIGDNETIDCYRRSGEKVLGYPARIHPDRWIWALIGQRIEVRLIAHTKSEEFRSTDRLARFLSHFNLAGMQSVSGPKLSGKEMERFLPKLGSR